MEHAQISTVARSKQHTNSGLIRSETLKPRISNPTSSPPRLFRLGKDLLFHTAVFSEVLKAAGPRRPPQVTSTPHWSCRVAFHNDV